MEENKSGKVLDTETLKEVSGGMVDASADAPARVARLGLLHHQPSNMRVDRPHQPWYVTFGTFFVRRLPWKKSPKTNENSGGGNGGR